MDLAKYARVAEKFVVDNSPLILTAIGVTGTVTTAVLTGKATFKAAKLIADAEFVAKQKEGAEPPSKADKVALTWKQYVLPAATGTLTCAAVIGANRISASRMAALAAGYTMLDNRFTDYRNEVLKKLGVKKEEELRADAAQKRTDGNPPTGIVVIGGKSLFRDEVTGRYFQSTMEEVKKAMNDTNYQIVSKEYASLSDFYERIGLPATSLSEEFGWYLDDQNKFDILFATTIHEGQPIITIDYPINPIRNGSPNQPSQKLRAL